MAIQDTASIRAAQNWTEILCSKGPTRRGYHSSFLYEGKLYVHAGNDITEGALGDLWALDLEELKKKRGNLVEGSLPPAGQDLYHSGTDSDLKWHRIRTSQREDSGRLSVRPQPGLRMASRPKAAPNEPGAIAHHSTVVFRDSMYLFGGSNGIVDNNRFFRLDLKSFMWEVIETFGPKSLIQTRDSHSAVVSEEFGSMYIFGGFTRG